MTMLDEIREIPDRAVDCYEQTRDLSLPLETPYLGMGSSFYASLVLKYLGLPIQCEMASEYHLFLASGQQEEMAVLISQSGRSSETLWCRAHFEQYYAITNDLESPLATTAGVAKAIPLQAGAEFASATKTYVNTLLVLYRGLGLDPQAAVRLLPARASQYEEWGGRLAEDMHSSLMKRQLKAVIVLGNGPHLGTAHQAALILSECTRLPVLAMTTAQFDHGPKESAPGCQILAVNPAGPAQERTTRLLERVRQAGACVDIWPAQDVSLEQTPITAIMPFNYLAAYLGRRLGVQKTFELGSKITEVH